MTWNLICHTLEEFGPGEIRQSGFSQCLELLLLDETALDRPGTVYVTDCTPCDLCFQQALLVSIGPCAALSANLICLTEGPLSAVFNTLALAKHRLDALDSALAPCGSDQEVVDRASAYLGLPMFYLDESYRVLAMSQQPGSGDDPEWAHMASKGYLSPESARRMKESGELELLASTREPVVYRSQIYPFPSIVSNVWLANRFVSRLNVLCVDGDTTLPMVEACGVVTAHLERLLVRSGRLPTGGPMQSMLTDLLRGVRLSQELIDERLSQFPPLASSLLLVFAVEMDSGDPQIAPYYASTLNRLFPEEGLIPVVFEDQLILLAHAPDEAGFNSLIVKLEYFFASHRLRCGVSNRFRGLSALRGYCDQAKAALQGDGPECMQFYRDVMLEHMLSFIPAGQAPFLVSPDIHRLQDAEQDFSFSPVDTLREYLACNCNLTQTAQRLFIHKNTLLYRLGHIKAILRCNLDDADERLLLMLSFKLLERTS